ncbi:YbgC/FadM family acyl-CoA thioesterase [Novosphingobium sp. 1949]|uniref:YbgC/FadM family acyl-CoA thioesterase n=1 Tax=Novosphingobium organovorum TaxID=2930092 RepID=A0ABT0BFV2_9SPHN|nr:YbgC/FadM family acyl-CoA thioesterase [Novosphingobium organovorum]MCJ2183738.1 YbgC/FadM family acyl-CoA thioesterase [Novosphingobium organovorum]
MNPALPLKDLAPTHGVIASAAADGQSAAHHYPLRVFYDDTDAGGVVYHSNYVSWFERARSDLLECLGIDQRAALEDGTGNYAVAEVAVRYRAPARLGDTVVIVTTAQSVGKVACVLRQVAWRGDTVLAEGTVKVGFIGPDGRPRRQPEGWQRAFATFSPLHPVLPGSDPTLP